MKRIAILPIGFFLTASLMLALCPPLVSADSLTSLEGPLRVMKDDKGNVTEAMVKVVEGNKDILYFVTLDEKGKEMASLLDGKEILARGEVGIKDGKSWLIVSEYLFVIMGTVSAETDEDGECTGIRFNGASGSGVFSITLDDRGKKLATEHNGKAVQLAGDFSMQEEKPWIAVKKWAALETLVGTIEIEEDDDGNPVGAKISVDGTSGEEAVAILLNDKGKGLMKEFPWERAEVTGVIYSKNGKKTLKVGNFKGAPIPDDDPEEPGDDDEEGGGGEEED